VAIRPRRAGARLYHAPLAVVNGHSGSWWNQVFEFSA
jgi:hypothetical protein